MRLYKEWQSNGSTYNISTRLQTPSSFHCIRTPHLLDSLQPHGLYSPWNSPDQNTGVGSLSLLQGIFPTPGSNPGLPHGRQILYQLTCQGSPRTLEQVAYPFSRGSSGPRNQTGSPALQADSLRTELSHLTAASLEAQLVKNLPAMWRPGFNPWVGKVPWRRKRLPTPIFWPGEFQALYSSWGHKESDTTDTSHFSEHLIKFH